MKTFLTRILLPLLLLAATGQGFLYAATATGTAVADTAAVEPDRLAPGFVRASIIVAAPGPAIYQAFGHAAIRLQCPTFGLDNVFSFETDNRGGWIGQFIGEANGRFARITTGEYLATFSREGRGVTEYVLNLAPAQELTLWRNLDISAESAVIDRFNIRQTHCMSTLLDELALAIKPDTVAVGAPHIAISNRAEMERLLSPARRWSALMYITAYGHDASVADTWRVRTTPLSFYDTFADAAIVSPDGSRRPFLLQGGCVLAPQTSSPKREWPQPMAASLALVAFVAVITALYVTRRFGTLAVWVYKGLFALQTCASLLLMFIVWMPNHIGACWNWLFIPLNPLPLAVWLLWRKRHARWVRVAFAVFGVADLLFAALGPWLTAQATAESSLLSVAVALPLLAYAFRR